MKASLLIGNLQKVSSSRQDGNYSSPFLRENSEIRTVMYRKIFTVVREFKVGCISAAHDNDSYCGNKIVEEGEECDCGRPAECDEVDKCCVARDDTNNISGCTIKPGKQCRYA